jgi:hypothetical protein
MGAFKLRKMLDEAMKRYVPSWDHGRRDERKLSAFEVFADIGYDESFEPEGRKMVSVRTSRLCSEDNEHLIYNCMFTTEFYYCILLFGCGCRAYAQWKTNTCFTTVSLLPMGGVFCTFFKLNISN